MFKRLVSTVIPVLLISVLVPIATSSPANAAAPSDPESVEAIEADGALVAGASINVTGSPTSLTLQALADNTDTPVVVSTCTATFATPTVSTYPKRCRLTGLTNGTQYYLRAKTSNTDGDSAWVWSLQWGTSSRQAWTPSATAVRLFSAGDHDCWVWASSPRPCVAANNDTVVTMTGQNLQACTSINAIGGGGAAIPVTPSIDGTSITFTHIAGTYGWANFNCGLGTQNAFFNNFVGSLAGSGSYAGTWSATSGSTAGGNIVTITTSNPVFVGVSQLKLQGRDVTYEVIDKYKIKMTIPAGTAGPADLLIATIDGVSMWSGPYTYVIQAPEAPTAEVTPGSGLIGVTITNFGTGGTPTTVTATVSPGGQSCTITLPDNSCNIDGLTNDTEYTVSIVSTNSGGSSSAVTYTATPRAVPGQPASASATASGTTAEVTWAVALSGGQPVDYLVTSSPGGLLCSANYPATTCTVYGLTYGQEYTFSVIARSPSGESSPVVSNAITPVENSGGGGSSSGSSNSTPTSATPKGMDGTGSTRTITGALLDEITSIKLNGQTLTFKLQADGSIVFDLPEELAAGFYDLVFTTKSGSMTWTNALHIRNAIVKPSSTQSSVKSVAGFAGNSAVLSKAQKTAIQRAIAGAKTLTCTGSTSNSKVTAGDRKLALARAKAACAYAKKLSPALVTKVSAKPSIAVGAHARKVVLTVTK